MLCRVGAELRRAGAHHFTSKEAVGARIEWSGRKVARGEHAGAVEAGEEDRGVRNNLGGKLLKRGGAAEGKDRIAGAQARFVCGGARVRISLHVAENHCGEGDV